MAISRFSNSTIANGFPKYTELWDQITEEFYPSYESIATLIASGSSQELTFSNIPQTYKHLEIRGIGQASYSSNDYGVIGVRFNGDSGSNYTRHALNGSGGGGSATSYGIVPSTYADCGNGAYLNTTNTVGASIITILDYTNTSKNKVAQGFSGTDNSGIGALNIASGVWSSTAAITSVTVYQQNANLTNKSTYALYGIKG